MKNLIALTLVTLSLNVMAQRPRSKVITVFYSNHHDRYYGDIETNEASLKKSIIKKASEFCGSLNNVALISNVEAKFKFTSIETDTTKFEGSYPLASGSATVYCHQ